MTIPYICLTSDKHDHMIPGFMHQWRKYAPEIPVTIAGFRQPQFDLLEGFDFVSIGDMANYPIGKWSNALKELLRGYAGGHVAILLEDYWLTRRADIWALGVCTEFMQSNPNALRFDITTDRLYSGNIAPVGAIGRVDIIEGLESPYQVSFQASIWNADHLSALLHSNWDPWQCEIAGGSRLKDEFPQLRVFGTRQWPLQYQIMVRGGKFERGGDWMNPARQLSNQDYQELESLNYVV
jgi:hypothetical protein